MPTPLSRIEREYVLKTLEESLPAFSVLSGQRLIRIPESGYTCVKGRFTLSSDALKSIGENNRSSIRFCFFHRQRGMFFDLPHETFKKGNAVFLLPEKVFLEDLSRDGFGDDSLSFTYDGVRYAAESAADFPLDRIMPDPALLPDKKNVFAKIAKKAGITDGPESAVYRLFEYLEACSGVDGGTGVDQACFLFIDHRFAIASFADTRPSSARFPPIGERIRLEIAMDKREIDTDACVLGSIAVRDRLSVYAFSLENPKEEDKRFLFERLYREKYR